VECPFPRHSVTTHFSKWSLTKCNRFHSKRGLILKLTLFRDDSKLIIDEIRERFSDRKDLLILRITKLQSARNVIYERFAIGRSSGIKELITIGQQRRITTFYDDSRSDGLVKRTEIFGLSVTEKFRDRGDGVVRRTMFLEAERERERESENALGSNSKHNLNQKTKTTKSRERKSAQIQNANDEAVRFRLCLGGDPNLECSVCKIEQQYSGQHDVGGIENGDKLGSGNDSVRLLTFDILKSEYAVNYHYGSNRILSKKCSFNKETGSVVGWNPNPLSTNPDAVALKQQFEDLIVAEKNLLTEIRDRERAFGVLLSKIEDEREPNNLSLIDDVYFAAKCRSKESQRQNADIDVIAESANGIESNIKMDAIKSVHSKSTHTQSQSEKSKYSMLHSFLPKSLKSISGGDSNLNQNLSREQIEQIKEDCLRSLKERLVQRLNIITKRLHSEIQNLEKEKAKFENWQNRGDHDGDDDMDSDHDVNQDGIGRGVDGSDRELLNQQKESAFREKQKESEFRINIIKQRLAKHEQDAIQKMNQLSDLLDSYPPLQ